MSKTKTVKIKILNQEIRSPHVSEVKEKQLNKSLSDMKPAFEQLR